VEPVVWWRRRLRRPRAGSLLTVLAFALVLVALITPDDLRGAGPSSFVRIPVEALVLVALVLAVPERSGRTDRARRWAVAAAGAVLGVLTVLKAFDIGYYSVLARPFDPVLDRVSLADGVEFLTTTSGRPVAIAAVVLGGLVAVAVPVLTAAAVLRITRTVLAHRTVATAGVAGFGVLWLVLAVLGVQIAPGVAVASHAGATQARACAVQVRDGLRDRAAFAREASVDAFATTPGDQLLTGLRGKDVVVAFVESYGRVALTDPAMGPQVSALLDAGGERLRAAGFDSRSALLESPTSGGGSWLAHSTLLSGLWIDNQQRYENLVAGDRLTLNGAFHRAGWRTVDVAPGVTRAWPEGSFYGYDTIYAEKDLGYRGKPFSWATMPDQYTLSQFEKLEHGPAHGPLMAQLTLVSSHAPWTPLPTTVGWDQLGDGSIFATRARRGGAPSLVWRDRDRVREAYRTSIEYTLTNLISWVQRYGDDHLVLVFLGDHQPAPIVTGRTAERAVPITIVARDPAVLRRVSGWGWSTGLRPGPNAPRWPMDEFRDRFLTAFGSTPGGSR
jgi:hypothetical protein